MSCTVQDNYPLTGYEKDEGTTDISDGPRLNRQINGRVQLTT